MKDDDNSFYSNCLAFLFGVVLTVCGHPIIGVLIALFLWSY
jgi:hypothetical protein